MARRRLGIALAAVALAFATSSLVFVGGRELPATRGGANAIDAAALVAPPLTPTVIAFRAPSLPGLIGANTHSRGRAIAFGIFLLAALSALAAAWQFSQRRLRRAASDASAWRTDARCTRGPPAIA